MENKSRIRLWTIIFWIGVWQLLSMVVNEQIFLTSPIKVIYRLSELVFTVVFWRAVMYSVVRIATGFFAALVVGVILAVIGARFKAFRELISPLMLVVKSVPVASFIILALIWLPSKNLSVLISFLMVLPVIYTNLLGAIESVDVELLEMSKVFRINAVRRIRYIYIPQVMPYLISACSIGAGLCWKAGVAAEVIAIPKGSIGEKLQQAKIYLDTPDLFAWTVAIVIVSLVFEKSVLFALKKIQIRVGRM